MEFKAGGSCAVSVFVNGEKGEDAKSSIFADLSNEMDTIVLDSNGLVKSSTDIETVASVWYGEQKLSITRIETNASTVNPSITVEATNSSGLIIFHVPRGIQIGSGSNFEITTHFLHNGKSQSKSLTLALGVVRNGADGKPAAVYKIIPSVDSLTLFKDGSYSVPTVSASRYKIEDGVSTVTTEGTLSYSIDNGGERTIGNDDPVQSIYIEKQVQFYFRDSNGNLLDTERVPLLKDGKDGGKGENPIIFDADNEVIAVAIGADNKAVPNQSWAVKFYCYNGSSQGEATVSSVSMVNDTNKITESHSGNIVTFYSMDINTWIEGDKVTASVRVSGSGKTGNVQITLYPAFAGKDGKPAKIYSLKPSLSALPYKRDEQSNIVGSNSIKVTILETVGDVVTEHKTDVSGLWLYRGFDEDYSLYMLKDEFQEISAEQAKNHKFFGYQLWDGNKSEGSSHLLDSETIPIVVDGEKGNQGDKGDKGPDGITPNANILDGSDFKKNYASWENRIGSIVKDGLESTYSFLARNVDSNIKLMNGERYPVTVSFLKQNIYKNLSKNTWYTLSFYGKKPSNFVNDISACRLFLSLNIIDRNSPVYVDGVQKATTNEPTFTFESTWGLHTFTFKSASSFSVGELAFRIFKNSGSNNSVQICAIKLEEGQIRTPWCLSENDKKAVEPNVNLMDKTSFRGEYQRAWSKIDGDALSGGMFGLNCFFKDSRGIMDSSVDILHYQLTNSARKIIKQNTWYTLSFWAKCGAQVPSGQRVLKTFLYQKFAETNNICIKDDVAKRNQFVDLREDWNLTSEWELHTLTFKTIEKFENSDDKTLIFKASKDSETYISAIKLEEGTEATGWCYSERDKAGSKLRMREWARNTEYFLGQDDEEYYDVVSITNNEKKQLYLCKQSHKSNDSNSPTTNHGLEFYWEPAQNWDFIATKLMLAEKIHASEIYTNELSVNSLISTNDVDKTSIRIQGGMLDVTGPSGAVNIKLGVKDGAAILQFFDNNEQLQYDLGPNGLSKVTSSSFEPIYLGYISDINLTDITRRIFDPDMVKWYRYQAVLTSDENNGVIFETPKVDRNNIIPDGFYTSEGGKGRLVKHGPKFDENKNEMLLGLPSIDGTYHMRTIFLISGGKKPTTSSTPGQIVLNVYKYVYWANDGRVQ